MHTVSPDAIFEVASNFMAAKALMVANDAGLFEALAPGPATVCELAARLDLDERPVRTLANAMVATGFLALDQDRYQNSPVAHAFLSGTDAAGSTENGADLRPMLRFMNQITYPQWAGLDRAVRTGQPVSPPAFTEERREIFSLGMESITSGTAQELAMVYNFDHHYRILDLGGGTGSFLATLLCQQPTLTATLMEQPSVAAIAEKRWSGEENDGSLNERLAVVAGDIFADPIPAGHDLVIIANVMHSFSPAENWSLLCHLRGGVPTGTRLLLIDFWTDPTHTQPAFAALTAVQFLISSAGGGVFSREEVGTWLQESGWTQIDSLSMSGASSLIVAEAI